MDGIFKNPISIWLIKLIKSKLCEFKNRKNYLKFGYLSYSINSKFGKYNTIQDNITLNNVRLGDFTYIGSNTKIQNSNIGKYCSIGPNVKIGLGRHPASTFVSTHPIFYSKNKQSQRIFTDRNYFEEYLPVEIGNDVWIAANAIVLDGIKINDGVIIAAGSVVTKDIPAYAIVGGIPAKIIRYRFDKESINKLLKLKWWNMEIEFLSKNFIKFHDIDDLLTNVEFINDKIRLDNS